MCCLHGSSLSYLFYFDLRYNFLAWIMNCVGYRNTRYFLLFLFYSCVYSAVWKYRAGSFLLSQSSFASKWCSALLFTTVILQTNDENNNSSHFTALFTTLQWILLFLKPFLPPAAAALGLKMRNLSLECQSKLGSFWRLNKYRLAFEKEKKSCVVVLESVVSSWEKKGRARDKN